MDFSERLQLYKEGGMISEKDVDDVNAIIKMFKDEYGVELQEENATCMSMVLLQDLQVQVLMFI